MTNQTCQQCRYYIQHYNYCDNHYSWVYCGHCTRRYHKHGQKRPDTPACNDFEQREQVEVVRNDELIATVKRLYEMLDKEFPPNR